MFSKLFEESKGKPVQYGNFTIYMVDRLTLPKRKCKLTLNIDSSDSEWRQGFELQLKGKIKVNGVKMENGVRIWEDTAPAKIVIKVQSEDGVLIISNIWDHGDGVTQKWYNGGAMRIEEIENGKRYLCNDGHPDDDFNDFIFELLFK